MQDTRKVGIRNLLAFFLVVLSAYIALSTHVSTSVDNNSGIARGKTQMGEKLREVRTEQEREIEEEVRRKKRVAIIIVYQKKAKKKKTKMTMMRMMRMSPNRKFCFRR